MKTKVWDPIVRILHWGLAISILGAAVTADSSRLLTLHIWFGALAILLVLTRLVWGFIGTHPARFTSFLKGPSHVRGYVRRMLQFRAPRTLGHNPAAAWVMMAMLLCVLLIGLSGLAALGGEEQIGPLTPWLGFRAGHFAKEVHEVLGGLLGIMVAAHLAGILLHIVLHRENIVKSMVNGEKALHAGDSPPPRTRWMPARIALSIIPALILAPWLFSLPFDYRAAPTRDALSGVAEPADMAWRKECGACHFAIPPTVLPARSWQHMFSNLEQHYGTDAWLPDGTRAQLAQYAQAHSADHVRTEAGHYLWREWSANATPMRFSESDYWKRRHRKIEFSVFRQSNVASAINCGACHRLALSGSFEDADVAIPNPEPPPPTRITGATGETSTAPTPGAPTGLMPGKTL